MSLEEYESLENITKMILQYYGLTEQIQLDKLSFKYLIK